MNYIIKATIKGIRPPIWRRLQVDGSLTFAQLHRVLQAAFGWLDYHLYRFSFDGIEVVEEDPDFTASELWGEGVRQLDPAETTIESLFESQRRCVYEYDFGDSWEHEIVVERSLPAGGGAPTPVCLDGARHRPPEDVGGVGGYESFLASIRDKTDPERDENLTWALKDTKDRLFDPEYFHLDEVNARLRHALKDTPEAAAAMFMGRGGFVGVLKGGWFEPVIAVGDEHYTWERLGRLLLMLEDDAEVIIKAREPKRSRS